MANTIEYVYKVSDQFSATLSKFQNSMKSIESRVAAMGKRMGELGSMMTTRVTLPVVGLGTAAVAAFTSFEDKMASVKTLIDPATESIDEMGNRIKHLAARVPVDMGELIDALYEIRSAGIPASMQFEVLEKSAQLAYAGLGKTSEAVNIATSAINAWGLQGAEAAGIYDTIFKAVEIGKTTIPQLAVGFGNVAKVMADANISTQQYFTAIGTLTTTGMEAAAAHVRMRGAIVALMTDSKELRQVYRKLGATGFKDLLAKSDNLADAFSKIVAAAGKKEGALKKLIGTDEGVAAIMGLTGGQAETFTKALNSLTNSTGEAGAMGAAFQKKMEASASSFALAKNSIKLTAVTVGEILIPYVVIAAEKIRILADYFQQLSPKTKKTILVVAGLVAVVGPLLIILSLIVKSMVILKMASAFSAVAGAIGTFALSLKSGLGLLGALKMTLLTNPIGILLLLIAAAVAILVTHWDDFIVGLQIIKGWLQPVIDLFGALWEKIKAIDFSAIFESGMAILNKFLTEIYAFAQQVKTIFENLIPDIKMPSLVGADVGGGIGEKLAGVVAGRRASVNNAVTATGEILVRAAPGSQVKRANISLNGGSNLGYAGR